MNSRTSSSHKTQTVLVLVVLATLVSPALAQEASQPAELTGSWLVLESVGRSGRQPLHTDALEAQIVTGQWKAPAAGDTVVVSDELTRTWQVATPGEDGWLRDAALRRGYACWTVESPDERVMLLDAKGHGMVYVNGEPRVGDPYGTGWVLVPVKLQPGPNTLLFTVGRGQVWAKLVAPEADYQLSNRDLTLPDFIRGSETPLTGAIPVLNNTEAPISGLFIEASCPGAALARAPVPTIGPLTTRKVGITMMPPTDCADESIDVTLALLHKDQRQPISKTMISMRVRDTADKHKRTFISGIDGSVQYFGVTPAHPPAGQEDKLALVLTLHGAGVEAIGQANAYDYKDWANIVAPTNRRPFGFDWEDWGRIDALEVLAKCGYDYDPQRLYLTGHSMGGHGTWQVGVTYPDKFAAIAPSAAWPDFWSYVTDDEKDEDPGMQMLDRAVNPSRTLQLSRNYLHYGVYILHGDQDDNVPVSLARKMREHLAGFHPDFAYYERPGAGHWWGSACVDWPPLFSFLSFHTRAQTADVRHIEFHTANPGISATSHWATIEAQTQALMPSSVTIDLDAEGRKFTGTTSNVARLSIDLCELAAAPATSDDSEAAPALPPGEPVTITLDEQTLESVPWPDGESHIWLRRDGEQWTVISKPDASLKGPHRYGPFKQAFDHRFVLVFGTLGTPEMNAALYARARYDAEVFWYRGNGSVEVVPDTAFDAAADRNRNVILYGNADTNAAWVSLLGECPVEVRQGSITIGQRQLKGEGLACLFVRPRPGSERALVGVVAGSGAEGLRLTQRLPYFVSGIGYPDLVVLDVQALRDPPAGIVAAGYFGIDWSVEGGEFVWRGE